MSTVCIIPARGGSKRIPRKNAKLFGGRPLLAWTIAAARESGVFDAILVSTDDEEIARIAADHGAEAPFRRPVALAHDHAPTLPVVEHALAWYEQHRGPVDLACCAYANPFLRAENLAAGFQQLQAHPATDFVVSVTTFDYPIHRALRTDVDGGVAMLWPENLLKRSQDLPATLHDAGQFYWGRRAAFQAHTVVFAARCRAVQLPRGQVQDLDTPEDWALAETRFPCVHA
jgi:N-acylneuraminate cytidylyltransferase